MRDWIGTQVSPSLRLDQGRGPKGLSPGMGQGQIGPELGTFGMEYNETIKTA